MPLNKNTYHWADFLLFWHNIDAVFDPFVFHLFCGRFSIFKEYCIDLAIRLTCHWFFYAIPEQKF